MVHGKLWRGHGNTEHGTTNMMGGLGSPAWCSCGDAPWEAAVSSLELGRMALQGMVGKVSAWAYSACDGECGAHLHHSGEWSGAITLMA